MTQAEFHQLFNENVDADLIGPLLRDAFTPYVFEPKPGSWDDFRGHLSDELQVAVEDIAVVGSGRLGFSLKPGNNLRAFSDRSDIDVVIVNENLFDQLWLDLLRAAYPRDQHLTRIGGWLNKRKNEVYTGWLSPLKIRLDKKIFGRRAVPVLEFNAKWFNTFKSASRHPPRRHEDITSRLYRSWQHAELYHLHSIAALRRTLKA